MNLIGIMANQLVTVVLLSVVTLVLLGFGFAHSPDSFFVFVGLALLINVGVYFSGRDGAARDSRGSWPAPSRQRPARRRLSPRRGWPGTRQRPTPSHSKAGPAST